MPVIADRVHEIGAFKVMEILARANSLRSAGADVIDMEVGEPDFATPQAIVEAGQLALTNGFTRYTDALGIPELRQAISQFYLEDYATAVPAERIVVTAGGSGGLLLTVALLTNAGDGWLMTDPGYPCNRNFVLALGGEPQLVPVGSNENYQLSVESIAAHWQANTRVVMLASPANPTGAVLTREELHKIAAFAAAKGAWLVVDEIYHGMEYDQGRSPSAVGLGENVIVVNSFSKYFAMTGWRLGWMVAPSAAMEPLERLAQNLFICPSAIAQKAALAAFSPAARQAMEANRAVLKARRDYLVPALRELGFRIAAVPAGAFYIYAELPAQCPDAERFCSQLLEQVHVGVTPGTDFGHHLASRHVRFSYAQPLALLEAAVHKIGRLLRS